MAQKTKGKTYWNIFNNIKDAAIEKYPTDLEKQKDYISSMIKKHGSKMMLDTNTLKTDLVNWVKKRWKGMEPAREEARETKKLMDTAKSIEDLPFEFEPGEFEYGGMSEEQRKYMDLMEDKGEEALRQAASQLTAQQVARGMGRSGVAQRQSAQLGNLYRNQILMNQLGYQKGLQDEAYGRFLDTEAKRYSQAADAYNRQLTALMNKQGLYGEKRRQLWSEQARESNYQNALRMAQLQHGNRLKQMDYQHKLNKPSGWDYGLAALSALGGVATGAGGLMSGIGALK